MTERFNEIVPARCLPQRQQQSITVVFGLLIFATALPYTDLLPQMVSYGLVVILYGAITLVAIRLRITTFIVDKGAAVAVGLIWLLYIWHLAAGTVSLNTFMRVPVFVFLTGINLFYLPRMIPRRTFFNTVSILAVFFVLIGLPTLVVGTYGIGPIEIRPWRSGFELFLGSGIRVKAIRSVFENPNPLSSVIALGLIPAFNKFIETRHRIYTATVVILATGLYFAHSRAAMGAALIGIVILLVYHLLNPRTFRQVMVVGGAIGVMMFIVAIGMIPAPAFFPSINFQGRLALWEGAIRAVIHRPLAGYGPGDTAELIAPFVVGRSTMNPHNSYLRLFVTTGIIGGFSYLYFVVRTVFGQFVRDMDGDDLTIFVLCVTVSIIQVFTAFSAFGISITSVLTAIVYGYGLRSLPEVG